MITVHPQYIKDANGKKSLVILSAKEFDSIIEELEELEDIKLYDKAKKEDTCKRILFSDYKTEKRKMPDYTVVLSKKAQKHIITLCHRKNIYK